MQFWIKWWNYWLSNGNWNQNLYFFCLSCMLFTTVLTKSKSIAHRNSKLICKTFWLRLIRQLLVAFSNKTYFQYSEVLHLHTLISEVFPLFIHGIIILWKYMSHYYNFVCTQIELLSKYYYLSVMKCLHIPLQLWYLSKHNNLMFMFTFL